MPTSFINDPGSETRSAGEGVLKQERTSDPQTVLGQSRWRTLEGAIRRRHPHEVHFASSRDTERPSIVRMITKMHRSWCRHPAVNGRPSGRTVTTPIRRRDKSSTARLGSCIIRCTVEPGIREQDVRVRRGSVAPCLAGTCRRQSDLWLAPKRASRALDCGRADDQFVMKPRCRFGVDSAGA
jgi:hypothetical protein